MYGFASEDERATFRQLLQRSPASLPHRAGGALRAIGHRSGPGHRAAGIAGSSRFPASAEDRRAPALELRDKLPGALRWPRGPGRRNMPGDDRGDIINALLALGYNEKSPRRGQRLPDGVGVSDGIRQALRAVEGMSAKLKQGFMRNVKLSPQPAPADETCGRPSSAPASTSNACPRLHWKPVVRMRLGLLNHNYMGTHFGGSLYAMTDPFFALLVMQTVRLTPTWWDKASSIDLQTPRPRGTVRAIFHRHARTGQNHRHPPPAVTNTSRCSRWTWSIEKGEVVATVEDSLCEAKPAL